MNTVVTEFIQIAQKVECGKLILRRLEAHRRVANDIRIKILFGDVNGKEIEKLVRELDEVQKEFMIQKDCIELFVLGENITKLYDLEKKSIRICDEIDKALS